MTAMRHATATTNAPMKILRIHVDVDFDFDVRPASTNPCMSSVESSTSG